MQFNYMKSVRETLEIDGIAYEGEVRQRVLLDVNEHENSEESEFEIVQHGFR